MNAFFIVCAIAALATIPIGELQAVCAAAASTLFESTPFILAAALGRRLLPRGARGFAALAGCGCGEGPGARSLAVAAATAIMFGPLVALLRLLAAFLVACRFKARERACGSVMDDLLSLLPYSLAAGATAGTLRFWMGAHLEPLAGFSAGAVLALLSPCTMGAVALAASLRASSLPATVAILLIAGIFDVRALKRHRHVAVQHDAFAYLIAAFSCANVALHRGATLVNPRFEVALWLCAASLGALACVHRNARSPQSRWAPLIMAAGTLCAGTIPTYAITETTLMQGAPGETLEFRGILARDGGQDALVRYAITCCRADAQPIAIRLKTSLAERTGRWFDARGILVRDERGIAFVIRMYKRIEVPSDPFIYR